jgi:membrane-associated phospholipid phosphatase
MNKTIATGISRICDPVIMLAVVFVVLVSHTPVFLPAFFSMVIVPFVLYLVAWKTKFVADWDMSDRRQRPKILWSLIGIEGICLYVFHLWILMPILIAFIGFTIMTHFWKISGHAMGAALATGIIVVRFGWVWWPVLLIVPLVAWARVVRRDHTIAQVIAGAVYAWVVIFIFT